MNFQIETVNFCGGPTCQECPNWMMQRKRQFMPQEIKDTILGDYVIPYRDFRPSHRKGEPADRFPPATVIPHKDGEPLLDRGLPAFLKAVSAADRDIRINVYSHGLFLPLWAKRGEDFIDFLGTLPNRCWLLVSFHFVNHDGTRNDYLAVDAYLRKKLRQKPENLTVALASHLHKGITEGELNRWFASWQQEICDRLCDVHANTHINPWTGLIEDPHNSTFNCCPYGGFDHIFFGASGNVIPCCLDLEEEIILGNVLEDNPAEVMQRLDDFYAEQRRIQEKKSGLKHEVCRNCFGMGKRQDLLQVGMPA